MPESNLLHRDRCPLIYEAGLIVRLRQLELDYLMSKASLNETLAEQWEVTRG